MPKLWSDSIEEHRRAVQEATLDAMGSLVHEHGARSVTMSQLAAEAGIGRATLYKYFSDVDTILVAWHQRLIADHLAHLTAVRDQTDGADERLNAVLLAYALISRHHDNALAAELHRGDHVIHARQHLTAFVRQLLIDAAIDGGVRTDTAPEELAGYCVHALGAATGLRSEAAVRRLVDVTISGLRPVPQATRKRSSRARSVDVKHSARPRSAGR